ncbi:MAG: cadmium-translocating P-type ATPase [Bacteroidales bacterium]|nr:cadmium-translocating P-type ATPase [Bacteroidales bacterium]
MESEVKEGIIRIVAGTVLLAAAIVIEKTCSLATWQLLLIYLVPYLVTGYDTLKEAAEGIAEGEALNENFLMAIATVGALAIGFLPGAEAQFAEAVFVMLFFQLGELFEGLAEDRSRRSIAHLTELRPDTASVLRNGEEAEVKCEEIVIGDTVLLRPGDRVPVDGIVLEGESSVDMKALTGESLPVALRPGDRILSGSINGGGLLRVRCEKAFSESTASKILELVENSATHKSRSEAFITRFAKVYTPVVVGAALLIAFLPPLFSGSFSTAFPTWLYRGLLFLVVSCPCALVISVPLSFFGGIGGASRHGILVKGSNYMEALSRVRNVVFDKTGTLTEGVFEVTAVHPDKIDERQLLHLASHVEHHSTHPIAAALRAAWDGGEDDCSIQEVSEVSGKGVTALVNGKKVAVGNTRLMDDEGAAWRDCHHGGTIVHVSIDGEYAGHIVISDRIKADAKDAVSDLKAQGVAKTVMLTGDRDAVAAAVAKAVGVDVYRSELLPAAKVEELEKLIPQGVTAFVGDGINDAPVLTRSDVGIAMGAIGSDAAIEAADVVIMDDKPSKVALAVKLARRTVRIARENIWFAIGIKFAVLALAAAGLATMGMAVFADVGVTFLCVLNAIRALR